MLVPASPLLGFFEEDPAGAVAVARRPAVALALPDDGEFALQQLAVEESGPDVVIPARKLSVIGVDTDELVIAAPFKIVRAQSLFDVDEEGFASLLVEDESDIFSLRVRTSVVLLDNPTEEVLLSSAIEESEEVAPIKISSRAVFLLPEEAGEF